MRFRRLSSCFAPLGLLALSGCGYVHVGRLPEPVTTVVGDDKLIKENSDLRTEKKMLQQELLLSRAQGDALRSAIENRTADGDTSRRLTEKLTDTTRDLALLRASYAQLQNQRASGSPLEVASLKAELAGTEEKLASSLRNYTQLQEEISGLRTEVARTRTENIALTEQVKIVTVKNTEVQLALAQLNAEFLVQKETRTRAEQDATTLRTQLDSANTRLSALAQQRTSTAADARSLADADGIELRGQLESLRQKVSALEAERTTLQQQLATKTGQADTKALADSQAQLISALNGAKMLRDENDQLKSARTELETELTKARAAAAGGGQTQSLRDQLAQVQAQASALSEENAQLKTRLSSNGSGASGATGSGNNAAPRSVVTVTTPGTNGTTTPVTTNTPRPAGSPVTATFVVTPPGGSPASATTISTTPAPAARSAANGTRLHTVTAGDTLSKISAQYYGTPGRWAEILVANRDVLGEDNNLVIGRQLRIP
jgi:nucleoid-associated protein YgaU